MTGIDPISAATELWQAGLKAKSLIEGVTGTFDNASDRVKGLKFNIDLYRKTFNDLQSILKKEQKTAEGYDGFVQTLKECDNFLESYNALQNGKAFGVKPKLSPMVLFHSFRYVYDDKDIARLEGRIVLQMTTINAVINMIIAKKLANSAGTRSSRIPNIEEEAGNLGQTKWQLKRPAALPESANVPISSQEDVEKLYDNVERILNRDKRVILGIQAQNARSITLQIDGAEVERVSELLKGRLLRNEPQPSTNLYQEVAGENDFLETSQERLKLLLKDENDLLRFSQERLKTLLSASRNQPALTTRIRVYGPDSQNFPPLPQPALGDAGGPSTATIHLPQTDLPPFELHSIDIVRDGDTRLVICTEKNEKMGIIHCLPNTRIFPFTKHRNISPKLYNKEVSIIESSTVEITGAEKGSFSNIRPLYTFSQHTDMTAFQSALRGSFLQRTFDIETVKAKTSELASSTHLKLWEDDEGIQSFTFYGNKLDPMTFLEFEISWFEPRAQSKGNTLTLTFRLPYKTKKKLSRKLSFGILRRPSSEVSDRQSTDRMNSIASETSTTETTPSQMGPEMQRLGFTLQQLKIEFSTSGAMKNFSTIFSSIHEKLNLPITLPILESSPSFQDSFQDHFQLDPPRSRPNASTAHYFQNPNHNTPEADTIFSPGISPRTRSTYADSMASYRTTRTSTSTTYSSSSTAPSFTTSVPSESSTRASSVAETIRSSKDGSLGSMFR